MQVTTTIAIKAGTHRRNGYRALRITSHEGREPHEHHHQRQGRRDPLGSLTSLRNGIERY